MYRNCSHYTLNYRNSPPGSLFIFAIFGRGLLEGGAYIRGLIQLSEICHIKNSFSKLLRFHNTVRTVSVQNHFITMSSHVISRDLFEGGLIIIYTSRMGATSRGELEYLLQTLKVMVNQVLFTR